MSKITYKDPLGFKALPVRAYDFQVDFKIQDDIFSTVVGDSSTNSQLLKRPQTSQWKLPTSHSKLKQKNEKQSSDDKFLIQGTSKASTALDNSRILNTSQAKTNNNFFISINADDGNDHNGVAGNVSKIPLSPNQEANNNNSKPQKNLFIPFTNSMPKKKLENNPKLALSLVKKKLLQDQTLSILKDYLKEEFVEDDNQSNKLVHSVFAGRKLVIPKEKQTKKKIFEAFDAEQAKKDGKEIVKKVRPIMQNMQRPLSANSLSTSSQKNPKIPIKKEEKPKNDSFYKIDNINEIDNDNDNNSNNNDYQQQGKKIRPMTAFSRAVKKFDNIKSVNDFVKQATKSEVTKEAAKADNNTSEDIDDINYVDGDDNQDNNEELPQNDEEELLQNYDNDSENNNENEEIKKNKAENEPKEAQNKNELTQSAIFKSSMANVCYFFF